MYSAAHLLANSLNPLFVALVVAAPLINRNKGRPILPFYVAAAGGLAVAVVLAESGKRFTQSGFPSGHETFALACATALVCWKTRWLFVAVPLAALMGWALVAANYHTPLDILGALLTGLPPALLAQWLRRGFTPN